MSSGSCKGAESLPEQTFPGGEVSALEERVLQNALHTTQGLNHVCAVVVEVPKLAIMPLMCPPKGVLLQNLVLFKVSSDTPAFIISQCVAVFLEKGIDSGNASIPRIF